MIPYDEESGVPLPPDPLVAAEVARFSDLHPDFAAIWAREVRTAVDCVCAGIAGHRMAERDEDTVLVALPECIVPVPRGMSELDVALVLLQDIQAAVAAWLEKMTGPGGFG